MELRTILQLQASLLLFLGAVVLLAHQTSRTPDANTSARWFFLSSMCGAAGLELQAYRGLWPAALSVVLGNFLFLLLLVLLTKSIAVAVQASSRVVSYLLLMAVVTVAVLSHYTFKQPDVTRRVFVVAVAMPILLVPAVLMLLRTKLEAVRVATRTLAAILIVFMIGCLSLVMEILHGRIMQGGASWPGVILIAGVTLCFLWMDMLRLRADLSEMALTDPLTGLLNRRAIEFLAARELAQASRKATAVTLLAIDIDSFKVINDTHGHMIGDAAILAIANVLKRSLREHDLAVRTGGDEFVILLTDSSPQIAEQVVRRIDMEVAKLDLKTHQGKRYEISATIGRFTTVPSKGRTYADLVHASDLDLYRRKQLRKRSASYVGRITGGSSVM